MNLSIIWVHFNTPKLLERSVETVLQQCQALGISYELIIVDNGGLDAQSRSLAINTSLADHATIVAGHGNVGYAAAINLGVAKSVGHTIVVLNPDVFLQPQCIRGLVNALRKNDIVAPLTYLDSSLLLRLPPTEKYDFFSVLLRSLAESFELVNRWARHRWRWHAHGAWRARYCYELSGAVLGFTRAAWTSVGRWNDAYFLYFEETDWLTRAKRAGLKASYVKDAQAVHLFAQSPQTDSDQAHYFAQSRNIFEHDYLRPWQRRILGYIRQWVSNRRFAGVDLNLENGSQKGSVQRQLERPSHLPCFVELSISRLGFPAAIAHITTARELEQVIEFITPLMKRKYRVSFNYDAKLLRLYASSANH